MTGLHIGKGIVIDLRGLLTFLVKNGCTSVDYVNKYSKKKKESCSIVQCLKQLNDDDDVFIEICYEIGKYIPTIFSQKFNIDGVSLINYPHDAEDNGLLALGMFQHMGSNEPGDRKQSSEANLKKLDNINNADASVLAKLFDETPLCLFIADRCHCCT